MESRHKNQKGKVRLIPAVKKFAGTKLGKRVLIGSAAMLLLAGVAYSVNANQYKEVFLEGTSINGIDVSNMTPMQVKNTLKPKVENYSLTMKLRDNKSETVSGQAIDYMYTPGGEIDAILEKQNPYAWITGTFGMKRKYKVKTPITYSKVKLMDWITALPEMQKDKIVSPVNASMALDENRQYYIVPEKLGSEVNRSLLNEAVEESLISMKQEIDLTKVEGVYANPEIYADDEALKKAVEDANAFLSTQISYTDDKGKEIKKIDASVTENWMVQDKKTGFFVTEEKTLNQAIENYVAEWAAKDDNYGNYRVFRSTNYGDVKIGTSAVHGHKLDQKEIASQIKDAVSKRESKTLPVPYEKYEDSKDKQFGGTYVEVDIDAQEVFVYQNYECVFNTNTVTGNEYSTPTPSGIYSIYYRERNAQLTGSMRADGTPSYVSNVSYWMAFYGGYGLHDATWRGSFGGSIYTYDGSHGCVNLSTTAARKIWNLTDYDTPVIVFREGDVD